MKFIDEVKISVKAGDGGKGCVSFRREKFIPRGGADGGDGGKGGDVIIQSVAGKRTLLQYRYKHLFKAESGRPGQNKQKTGRSGKNLILEVPVGTQVKNIETEEILVDLIKPDQTHMIAKGGRGGVGNLHFSSSTNRSPRFAQPGEKGEELDLIFELKLLADVGIIGLPNAGKSTLISVLTSARPKIDNYPFTTLTPTLGVVQPDWGEPFVLADIPGLIEGAHKGIGLGIRFLKHIERTRILIHLIDASDIDPDCPLKNYHTINNELSEYQINLAQKKQIIVLNKMDVSESLFNADLFEKEINSKKIIKISAVTGKGIPQLLEKLTKYVDKE